MPPPTVPRQKTSSWPLDVQAKDFFLKLDHLLVCGLEEEMPGFQLKWQLLLAQSGMDL